MKTLLILLMAIVPGLNIYPTGKSVKRDADLKKLNWLCATWKRTDSKPGTSGTERWWKSADGKELQGLGVTMRGKDTVFVEKLKIISKDGSLYYVADVSKTKPPVHFKFTSMSVDGTAFACENKENDFPNVISYKLQGEKIVAAISGKGKTVPYTFEKM